MSSLSILNCVCYLYDEYLYAKNCVPKAPPIKAVELCTT